MKLLNNKLLIILLFFSVIMMENIYAQDSAAAPIILGMRYFLQANKVPYIEITTKKKEGRKFLPVKDITVNIFYNEAIDKNLLGKTTTNDKGEGIIAFPASFKSSWDSLTEFKLLAESVPSKGEEKLEADLTIKKAILVIDTMNEEGVKSVTAQLKEKKGNEWVAVKDAEMKIGIKQLLGNLTVGDAETYTSDSSGAATAEFKRDSMPGDEKGNITLVAKVEDNDTYGNLVVEKSVSWGKPTQADTHFWHRTLWSTGNLAPAWLLFLAVSIVIGVWGTIIYLILQVIKIKKLGRA
jgi:hypothetical protein